MVEILETQSAKERSKNSRTEKKKLWNTVPGTNSGVKTFVYKEYKNLLLNKFSDKHLEKGLF